MVNVDSSVHLGRTGAKRQSWSEDNPRSILLKLIADNPHDTNQDEAAILDLLWDAVKNNEKVLRTICLYWGTNNYRYIVSSVKVNPILRSQVEEVKEKIVKNLLGWVMPNGKSLGSCTKRDCLAAGGWLTAVGKRLKPNQTVSQVFSEKDLRVMIEKN
jgi:hypothetical protein